MVIEYIKTLISAGWTQQRIAEATGLVAPNISRILNGRQRDVYFTQGKKLETLAQGVKKSQDRKARRKAKWKSS